MLSGPAATGEHAAGDDGFTLIELILSIALLGLVFGAISLAMVASLRTNDETQGRLDETRDEQFVAAYLASDVAGATAVVANAPSQCGPGTALLEVRGETFDAAASPPAARATRATYVFTTTTVDGVLTGSLSRRVCESAGAPPYPPTGTTTLASALAPTTPVVSCSPAPCSAASTRVSVRFDRLTGGDPFTLSATRRTTP